MQNITSKRKTTKKTHNTSIHTATALPLAHNTYHFQNLHTHTPGDTRAKHRAHWTHKAHTPLHIALQNVNTRTCRTHKSTHIPILATSSTSKSSYSHQDHTRDASRTHCSTSKSSYSYSTSHLVVRSSQRSQRGRTVWPRRDEELIRTGESKKKQNGARLLRSPCHRPGGGSRFRNVHGYSNPLCTGRAPQARAPAPQRGP